VGREEEHLQQRGKYIRDNFEIFLLRERVWGKKTRFQEGSEECVDGSGKCTNLKQTFWDFPAVDTTIKGKDLHARMDGESIERKCR